MKMLFTLQVWCYNWEKYNYTTILFQSRLVSIVQIIKIVKAILWKTTKELIKESETRIKEDRKMDIFNNTNRCRMSWVPALGMIILFLWKVKWTFSFIYEIIQKQWMVPSLFQAILSRAEQDGQEGISAFPKLRWGVR